jgi:hypothetical protein
VSELVATVRLSIPAEGLVTAVTTNATVAELATLLRSVTVTSLPDVLHPVDEVGLAPGVSVPFTVYSPVGGLGNTVPQGATTVIVPPGASAPAALVVKSMVYVALAAAVVGLGLAVTPETEVVVAAVIVYDVLGTGLRSAEVATVNV